MQDFNYITHLDGDLRACVSLQKHLNSDESWRMNVQLFYQGEAVGNTSFDLHGHSETEAQQVATNIKNSAFVMREIDEYLWGESD